MASCPPPCPTAGPRPGGLSSGKKPGTGREPWSPSVTAEVAAVPAPTHPCPSNKQGLGQGSGGRGPGHVCG